MVSILGAVLLWNRVLEERKAARKLVLTFLLIILVFLLFVIKFKLDSLTSESQHLGADLTKTYAKRVPTISFDSLFIHRVYMEGNRGLLDQH
jgi:hypothetical protein